MKSESFSFPVRRAAVTAAAAFLAVTTAAAADAPILFNRDIRPVLSDNCFHCHGPDSGKRKAGLRLDTKEGLFGATKKEGPVVTPGDAAHSALWRRIESKDPEEAMPPADSHKALTATQRALLGRWIAGGAPWQPHWSFLKPTRPEVPKTRDPGWVRNPVDAFVLDRLASVSLAPAPEADRRTLVRRVSLDLTGLPPSSADVEAIVADKSPDWYERYVDRLLDSKAWGEHRARYWLDAARYADTHGLHFDNYREMWPYRDWVIRAFNDNLPFDRFTTEQIAGDLLPDPTDDQLIATGFHRCNVTTNEGGTIADENLANYARDRVETTSWVWLGLTANCSTSHDHKFDPVTMRDFYSMSAFFRNTQQGAFDGNAKDSSPSMVVPQSEADRARWKELPVEIAAAKHRLENRRRDARSDFEAWLAGGTAGKSVAGPSTNGLVAHAVLNDGKGDVAALRVGVAPATRAPGKVEWKDGGPLGQAPVVKADATFVLGDSGDFERDQPFSYGAWVRVPAGGRYQSALARMDQRDGARGWDLFAHDRNWAVHLVHAWPDDALKVVTTGDVLHPGEWQHVFVTYDGSGRASGVSIYVDGTAAKTRVEKDALAHTIRTGVPLRIGQRSHDDLLEGGQLQDVRVYARRLDPWDVRSLAKDGPEIVLAGLPPAQRDAAATQALYDRYLDHRDPGFFLTKAEIARLEAEREAVRKRNPVTHVQREKPDSKPVARVLFRGQYDKPREEVGAGTIASLHPMPEGAPRNRLGLARWLVSPENPLAARVTVNRYWQEVFGTGLVKTTEDFGIVGDNPSNPALLDWLAVEFRDGGWDTKHMFRLLVTSAAYRQSGATTPAKLEKDPANRLLSRGPRFRMDAEMVRDYALATSGLLSRKIGGPSAKPYQPDGVWEAVAMPESNTKKYERERGEGGRRRSLYTFWKRSAPPALMDLFNAPSRETCAVRRERTDTPLQALATLNDPQFVEAARAIAQDSLRTRKEPPAAAAESIARRILLRPLRPDEAAVARDSLDRMRTFYAAHPGEAVRMLGVGDLAPDPRLPAVEVAARTLLANQFLNLDEVLNK